MRTSIKNVGLSTLIAATLGLTACVSDDALIGEQAASTEPVPSEPMPASHGSPTAPGTVGTLAFDACAGDTSAVTLATEYNGTDYAAGIWNADVVETVIANGAYVYYTVHPIRDNVYENRTMIKRVAKSGGAPETIADEVGGIPNVELDLTHIYWVTIDTETGFTSALRRKSRFGGAVQTLATSASGEKFNGNISVGLEGVYVAISRMQDWNTLGSRVDRISKVSGAATNVIPETNLAPGYHWQTLKSTPLRLFAGATSDEGDHGQVGLKNTIASSGPFQQIAVDSEGVPLRQPLDFEMTTGGIFWFDNMRAKVWRADLNGHNAQPWVDLLAYNDVVNTVQATELSGSTLHVAAYSSLDDGNNLHIFRLPSPGVPPQLLAVIPPSSGGQYSLTSDAHCLYAAGSTTVHRVKK